MKSFGLVLEITFVLLQWCTILGNAQMPTTTAYTSKKPNQKTTKSLFELLKFSKQKAMQFEYYPNYGFEPYWVDGEWLLTTTLAPNISRLEKTTRRPEVCSEECNYLFQRIKHVCARKSDETAKDPNGCGAIMPTFWAARFCDGKPGHNFDHGYHNFDTYCKFLDAQCRTKFYEKSRWVLVHIGKCKELVSYFKPIWEADQPVSRMKWYLSSLVTEED